MGALTPARFFIFIAALIVGAILFFRAQHDSFSSSPMKPGLLSGVLPKAGPSGSNKNDIAAANETPLGYSASSPAVAKAPSSSATPPKAQPLFLTAGNFESFVLRCFQGEACRLAEDPMHLYKDFKLAGNTKACEDLIAFLRKQLLEAEFRNQYKELVKNLIDDFYPPDQREFQQAAYYAYAGDPQKSLDLYLDMNKRAQADASLPPAPPLNVANVLYDMGHFKEALPYYESALNEYNYGAQTLSPSTSETITYIEERLALIKAKP